MCRFSTDLDIVALVIVTAFAEKSVVHNAMDIELIKEGIAVLHALAFVSSVKNHKTYLRDRSSEHNNFIQLANPLHKLIDAGTLDNVYVVVLAFNLDRNGEVGLMQYLWMLGDPSTLQVK